MIFHLPVLSRLDLGLVRSPGPGLGNLLFPIARALLGARDRGGVFVRPTVRQIKIGTYLRREPDKRTYGAVFRHRSRHEWANWARARTARQLTEGTPLPTGNATLRYAGLGRCFHDLAGEASTVAAFVDRYARYEGLVEQAPDIAVHVRLGDFPAGDGGGDTNTRIPLAWYGEAIDAAARLIGAPRPRIMLFSDSADAALGDLPTRFALRRDPSRNALTAIRNLSRARILVASRSTFSMWGTFLGGSPAIWDATFDREPYFPTRPGLDHAL